jgi:hypothetical protein
VLNSRPTSAGTKTWVLLAGCSRRGKNVPATTIPKSWKGQVRWEVVFLHMGSSEICDEPLRSGGRSAKRLTYPKFPYMPHATSQGRLPLAFFLWCPANCACVHVCTVRAVHKLTYTWASIAPAAPARACICQLFDRHCSRDCNVYLPHTN